MQPRASPLHSEQINRPTGSSPNPNQYAAGQAMSLTLFRA